MGAGLAAAAAGAASPNAVPQSAQNLALAEVSVPHFGQRIGSGLPHSAQNRLPDKLSAPHFEQRIFPHHVAVVSPAKADDRIETLREPVAGVTTRC
jgi:hypothetical protein